MEQRKITRSDLVSMFLRSNLQQASFNFERIHGLGFCYDMIPAIKRLYPLKEDQVAALKRHLVFFNTTPAVCGPVIGVTAAMEEARANGAEIDDGTINGIKVGLMGPLAGVGDPLVWGTLRPITAALGASLALSGNILGPLLFFFIFNAVRLAMKWYGLQLGFRKGVNIVSDMGGNVLQKLTEGAVPPPPIPRINSSVIGFHRPSPDNFHDRYPQWRILFTRSPGLVRKTSLWESLSVRPIGNTRLLWLMKSTMLSRLPSSVVLTIPTGLFRR